MRPMLDLNNSIIVCCVILFSMLTSFNTHSKTTSAAPEIIQIIDRDGESDNLIMRDVNENRAEVFNVASGQNIKWLLKNNESVKRITNIYKKDISENVFSTEPHPIGASPNWEGTIDANADGKIESYNIDWVDAEGKTHTFDPVIQVKPKPL